MITRRRLLAAGLALGAWPLGSVRAEGGLPALWRGWREALVATGARVESRGWTLTPLAIRPPATTEDLDRVSTLYGQALPGQLRDLLADCAAAVTFGWSVPPLLQPLEGLDFPASGGLAGSVWSIDHLQGRAIDAFRAIRTDGPDEAGGGADGSVSWDRQFPWMALDDITVLAIDLSRAEGPQPVRCFTGHDDGLHGRVIAPDLLSFVSTYVALGCAGSTTADWIRFMSCREDGATLIDVDSDGARRWRAWFNREAGDRRPDEPPPAVAARTRSDFDLLETARADSAWGVGVNLASGAVPDCVDARRAEDGGGGTITFTTALVHALRNDDVAMAAQLLRAGATLDTRRIALTEAFLGSSAATARWVLAAGGRVQGWSGDVVSPLLGLLDADADRSRMTDAERLDFLDLILKAGADPNARGSGHRTALMTAELAPAKRLLAHGADPCLFDRAGDTALHLTRDVGKIDLLLRHGADVNALALRPSAFNRIYDQPAKTPVQGALLLSDRSIVDALLRAGADLRKRDVTGCDSLWYCRTAADADLCMAAGCDPSARDRAGNTLLQGVLRAFAGRLLDSATALPLFDDLIARGVPINARRRDGATALHLAAAWGDRACVQALLDRGADRTIRDAQGHPPADWVPNDKRDIRALLAT